MGIICSSLVSGTLLSPHNYMRTAPIDTITIHHAAAVGVSAKQIGMTFQSASRKASSNYGIGADGEIMCYVPENYRAITSSSTANDNRAVTIECANSSGDPDWRVSGATYASLLNLCEDVCRRNGKKRMVWIWDKTAALAVTPAKDVMRMTLHQWFAATGCPGDYLVSKMPEIAAEVTRRLKGDNMQRYNTLAEIPAWGQATVKKLCDAEIIKGNGKTDKDGYPADMDLSLDMIRLLVWNDRAGVYDGR